MKILMLECGELINLDHLVHVFREPTDEWMENGYGKREITDDDVEFIAQMTDGYRIGISKADAQAIADTA